MCQHLIDELLVGPLRVIEAELLVGRALFARVRARTEIPIAEINSFSLSREGGVLRYSITVGSTPLWRIMASVLREMPQSGL